MCNAYNHPSNCPCGFGGNGNHNTRYIETQIYHPCYIDPNANCPVCGESVYYFQSHNGGRVFFDDLWPDWPKHPCTDNNNKVPISNKYYYHKKLDIDNTKYTPIMIQYVIHEGHWNPHKLVANIIDDNGNFIKLLNHSLYDSSQIHKYSFFFYSRLSPDSFEIKCYKLNGEETIKKGYIEIKINKGDEIDLFFDRKIHDKYYFKHFGEFSKYIFYATKGSMQKPTLDRITREENSIQVRAKIIFIKLEEICVRQL